MHSRCGICGASLQEGDVQPEALCVRCSTCGGIYGLLRSEAEALLARAGRVPPATGIGRKWMMAGNWCVRATSCT
ncbi:hypothetical protein JQX13_26365 [Archangium violaceum]|uniref:hypothetical protein n=1 Tax=Archangium violaceum TaxID=83451 RepID=UPI00193BA7E6|nr:hypothetical protein [Archangium violaceum]QRK13244.1 hypothetical protein JQX13_26365 [Archangium violaceum]